MNYTAEQRRILARASLLIHIMNAEHDEENKSHLAPQLEEMSSWPEATWLTKTEYLKEGFSQQLELKLRMYARQLSLHQPGSKGPNDITPEELWTAVHHLSDLIIHALRPDSTGDKRRMTVDRPILKGDDVITILAWLLSPSSPSEPIWVSISLDCLVSHPTVIDGVALNRQEQHWLSRASCVPKVYDSLSLQRDMKGIRQAILRFARSGPLEEQSHYANVSEKLRSIQTPR